MTTRSRKGLQKPKPYFDQMRITKLSHGYVIEVTLDDIIGPKVAKEVGNWFLKASKYLESKKGEK